MRSLLFRFGWFSLSAALFSLSACSSSHDDLSKRLATLQSELTRLQNHGNRLEERLEALEMRQSAAGALTRAATRDSAANAERPRLLVVKLEPDDDARAAPSSAPSAALPADESASDPSPRPMIRVYGSRTEGDSGKDRAKRTR
jgi:peptidoglycan hydrolase CwlO-like protein